MKQRGEILLYVVIGLAVVGILAAIAYGIDSRAYERGVTVQKAEDQKEFDRINGELTTQKAEANRLLQKAGADIIALMAERAKLTAKLEKQHADNQAATAALRDKYAGVGLRFAAPEGSGCGAGGGGSQGASSDAASTPATAVIQLPDALTRNLRRLAEDADKLKDEYALCYAWAGEVK